MLEKTNKSKLSKFLCSLFFALITLTTFFIPSVCAAGTKINWDKIKYDVAQTVSVRTGFSNAIRKSEYLLLSGCCKLIDMFENALNSLININLYTLIKDQFNIKTVVYPVAWTLASLAIIFAAIMLIIKADKMRLSDFYRNLFCSLMLLVALPTLVASLSSLKTKGTNDVKTSFATDMVYSDDTTVSSQSLGETLLANYVVSVEWSLQKNKLIKYADTENFTDNPATVYALNINDTLNTDVYNKKLSSSEPPKLEQTKYSNLQLIDKMRLLDDEFATTTSSTGGKSSLVSIYEMWDKKEDSYVLKDSSENVYAKTGGGLTAPKKIWCRYIPNNDFTSYSLHSQVLSNDIVYTSGYNSPSTKEPIPFFREYYRIDNNNYSEFGYKNAESAKKDDRWKAYWEYHTVKAYNYQKLLTIRLNSYLSNLRYKENIPDEFKSVFSAWWFNNNVVNASSIEEAISNIEKEKVEIGKSGKSYSLIEYLNLEDNYQKYINGSQNGGSSKFIDLYSENEYNRLGSVEQAIKSVETLGYPIEEIYQFDISFFYGIIIMVITLISLIFSGFKLAGLLYDVLFAQIIAPLVVASDLQGSGRAKQVIQNLISCNICFVVVVFILRLYLWVIMAAQTKYSFLVVIFLTLAGAKFVIDGPDLVVKILGIDAGVKSGAATLMSLRNAGQIASGITRTGKNIASAPARMAKGAAVKAGQAKAAKSDIKNEEGFGNKFKAAVANTGIGQAFRQGANSQRQTNDNYRNSNDNNTSELTSESSSKATKDGTSGSASTKSTNGIGQAFKNNSSATTKDDSTSQTTNAGGASATGNNSGSSVSQTANENKSQTSSQETKSSASMNSERKENDSVSSNNQNIAPFSADMTGSSQPSSSKNNNDNSSISDVNALTSMKNSNASNGTDSIASSHSGNSNVNVTNISSVNNSSVSNNSVNTVANNTQNTSNNNQNSVVNTNTKNSVKNSQTSNTHKSEQSSVINNTQSVINNKNSGTSATVINGRDGISIKGDKGEKGEVTPNEQRTISNEPDSKR